MAHKDLVLSRRIPSGGCDVQSLMLPPAIRLRNLSPKFPLMSGSSFWELIGFDACDSTEISKWLNVVNELACQDSDDSRMLLRVRYNSSILPELLSKGFRVCGVARTNGRLRSLDDVEHWVPLANLIRKPVAPVVLLGRANVNLLGHVRSLGMCGIRVFSILLRDEDPSIINSSRYSAGVVDMRGAGEKDVVQSIIEISRDQGQKPVLMAAGDPEVSFVARHWEDLRGHVEVAWDPERCDRYSNKEMQLELVGKAGIRVPRSCSLTIPKDLEKLQGFVFPVICKPIELARKGIFPGKLLILQTYDELRQKVAPILESNGSLLIAQEYIPGDIQNILFCIADCDGAGDVNCVVTGRKLRDNTRGGMGVGETIPIVDLEDHARQVFKTFGVGGVLGVEFKKHAETGELYYIESNFRPENFHSIAPAAGVNVLLSNYLRTIGYPDLYQPLPQRQVRWMDFSLVVLGWLGKRGEFKKLGRFRFFNSVPTVDALWRWDDLMPGIVWYALKSIALIRKILRRARRSFGIRDKK